MTEKLKTTSTELIDHFPSAEELKAQAEQRDRTAMNVSRRALHAQMEGTETETDPVILNQKYRPEHKMVELPPSPTRPVVESGTAPAPEPYIPSENARMIYGAELRALREQAQAIDESQPPTQQ